MNSNFETTYPAVVGQIIVKVRKAKGLDQAAISRKTGISRPTLSRIENGEIELKMTALTQIAKALRISAADILTQADESRRNLVKAGVTVHDELIAMPKESVNGIGGLVFATLGAFALGAIIENLLAGKDEKSPEEGAEK